MIKKSIKRYYVGDNSSMNTKTEKGKQLSLTNIPWTSIQLPCDTYCSLPQTGHLVNLFLILCSFYIPITHLQEISFRNKWPGHQLGLRVSLRGQRGRTPTVTHGHSCLFRPL